MVIVCHIPQCSDREMGISYSSISYGALVSHLDEAVSHLLSRPAAATKGWAFDPVFFFFFSTLIFGYILFVQYDKTVTTLNLCDQITRVSDLLSVILFYSL